MAYAKAHYKDNSNYFMDYDYGGNGNCQNFASQCVWAGYGGASNLKSNIKNQVKMTSEWYCGPNGGSSAWINVNTFKSYVTKTKSTGPIGHVYNNQKVYTDFSATGIKSGEILQLKNGSSGGDNYSHSIYVLSTTASTSSDYNKIKIASNTGTYCDVPLKSYMIDYFGGSNCYMRDIAFSRANF